MRTPRYMFSDIPNDEKGREFVKTIREYVNTDKYSVRVRGQYLKKGNNWRKYVHGQPISKSKCLRIYIDRKTK